MPVLIVHVSTPEAIERDPRRAERSARGSTRETCPQYLVPHRGGHRPPRRRRARSSAAARRRATRRRRRRSGRARGTARSRSIPPITRPTASTRPASLPKGEKTTFKEMANGVPGLELRLPLLFSEGVLQEPHHASTNSSRSRRPTTRSIYGLYPRKGTIAIGSDADLAIWDPESRTHRQPMMHDTVGYTPYEGHELTGWPEIVLCRGRVVVEDGEVESRSAARGAFPRARRAGPGGRSAASIDGPARKLRARSSANGQTPQNRRRPARAAPPRDTRARCRRSGCIEPAARSARHGREVRRLPRARAHHVLPALVDGGPGRGRSTVLRATHALDRDAAAVRRGEEARHRLLHRLRRADAGRAARFNTAILVGPDGAIVGKYRKVHLPGHAEHKPKARVPAPGEEVLRGRRPRLSRLALHRTRSPAC